MQYLDTISLNYSNYVHIEPGRCKNFNIHYSSFVGKGGGGRVMYKRDLQFTVSGIPDKESVCIIGI